MTRHAVYGNIVCYSTEDHDGSASDGTRVQILVCKRCLRERVAARDQAAHVELALCGHPHQRRQVRGGAGAVRSHDFDLTADDVRDGHGRVHTHRCDSYLRRSRVGQKTQISIRLYYLGYLIGLHSFNPRRDAT
eukprot:1176209-Prorocentrum_minimum.AAC.3